MQYLASLNGDIVHISRAKMHQSGYTCLCCGKPMIVYKGMKKGKDHFQHRSGTCAETSDDVLINYSIQYLFKHTEKAFSLGKDKSGVNTYVQLDRFDSFQYDKSGKFIVGSHGKVRVYPDLIFSNKDKEIYVYITNKKRVSDAELEKYSALYEDGKYPWDVYVVNIKLGGLIKFFNDPDIVDMRPSYKYYIEKALYEDSIGIPVERKVYHFSKSEYLRRQSQRPLKKLGTTNFKGNVDDVKQRKVPKNLYGKCGICNKPLELVINTYNDASKPIADISTEHIRDDKNEDKDLQARFDLGALLLRCPYCHRVTTVKCPRCLSAGKVNDMKLLINYKRQHIYACCEDYHSITDMVNGSCKMKEEEICNTSLVLYSDVEAKTVSEEQKRVGGFFNWLTHFNEVNYKKKED